MILAFVLLLVCIIAVMQITKTNENFSNHIPVIYNHIPAISIPPVVVKPTCKITGHETRTEDIKAEMSGLYDKLLAMNRDLQEDQIPNRTLHVPLNAFSDIEPAAITVGSCKRGFLTQKDIDTILTKNRDRATELSVIIGDPFSLQGVEKQLVTLNQLLSQCSKTVVANDIPPGVRDPGYHDAGSALPFSNYSETG